MNSNHLMEDVQRMIPLIRPGQPLTLYRTQYGLMARKLFRLRASVDYPNSWFAMTESEDKVPDALYDGRRIQVRQVDDP